MKKNELLCPSGDMESLHQAVFNGADAVYLSGYNFGARKFAKNFSNEELVSAIKFCHLYGVKIYITMNTLVYNNEIEDFISQARFLHKNGVDALIVQDFGMICYLREKFPNLEIHASTQANNSSKESIELLHKLGVKRVVLSRELSIDKIDDIDTPIEKEAFIHGALCISYSGRCLMSSMLGGRSGNRGECAGCCRMKYSLLENNHMIIKDKYLLSTKELNTSSNIERLLDSSIDSFKIEGRMKSPLYVGFITRLYRKLIDRESINLKEETDKLKTIFNREFTKGRLLYEDDNNFLNIESPNHIGLKIGKSKIEKNKIKITLDNNKTLNQNDAIRFQKNNQGMIVNYLYDKDLKLCKAINQIGYVDNKWDIMEEDIVYKTQDKSLDNDYLLTETLYKIPISFYVEAKIGKPLKITISDQENEITREGQIIEKAITLPTSQETIIEKLQKIHDTPFEIKNIIIDKDSLGFIQIKQINDIKRKLIQELMKKRENKNKEFIEKKVDFPIHKDNNSIIKYTCSIMNEEQLKECMNYPFERIYVSNESLYEKYKKNDTIYFKLPSCSYEYKNILKEKNIMNDMIQSNDYNIYGGYPLNNTNIYTGYYLKKFGLKNIPLSCEMNLKQINEYIEDYNNTFNPEEFEILSYGRIENMIIKGNILNLKENQYDYQLKDERNRKYPVFYDGVNTHILNHEKRDYIKYDNIIATHRFDFYEESVDDIKKIVNHIFN